MKKDKRIKTIKRIIIILVILLVITIGILLIVIKNSSKQQEETNINKETVVANIEEEQENFLKTKGEKERIQIYLTTYLNYIENEQYEQAYSLLYEDFKKLYYPFIDFYIEYVKNNYFDVMQIEYKDIQRQGEYYIVSVELLDVIDSFKIKTQKFVIYEKGVNDFVLSFQAQ